MVNAGDVIVRLKHATELAELLVAAYDAFEEVLELIRHHDDPAGQSFVPMTMAGASAASGRDYVGIAPSLPKLSLASPARRSGVRAGALAGSGSAERITTICRLLVLALAASASDGSSYEDRRACSNAARCAQEICNLLSGQRA